jgi:hypothetical protein
LQPDNGEVIGAAPRSNMSLSLIHLVSALTVDL